MTHLPSLTQSAQSPAAALIRAGFTPVSPVQHRRGDISLTIGAHWCECEAPAGGALNPSGLWKRVGAGAGSRWTAALPRRVWDRAASMEASFESDAPVLEQCLHWLAETFVSSAAPDWQAPPRAEVESWFKPEQLTVVSGALLRQGEVICEARRLGLRFVLLPEIPPDLAAARLGWLRVLLAEAQERWHLVRFSLVSETPETPNVVAEVDLTGVPHELAEDLFVLSLEALRWVVRWLGETTDWLADATVASDLLAVCPEQQTKEKSP